MYTFTDITLSHNKLWHKTLFKNGRNCEGSGPLKQHFRSGEIAVGRSEKLFKNFFRSGDKTRSVEDMQASNFIFGLIATLDDL